MNKDNLIEFAKEQCEIFPEDSAMGIYLRETLKMLQAEQCEDAVEWSIKEMKALADPKNTILEFDEKMGLKTAMNILLRNIGYAPDTNVGSKMQVKPCEDAISRSSVFEIMGNLMSIPYDLDRRITEKDVSESMDEIRVLPPVTPIRKKGKWIEERDGYGNITGWHCSNCYDKTGFVTTCTWDYCPSCGAEMESEEE